MGGEGLRPLERVVLRMADQGWTSPQIAWRFRRSPGHIERVLELSRVPRRGRRDPDGDASGLRPVERLVLRARDNGVSPTEIAARIRRSPEYVTRVEELAELKRRASGAAAS